MNARKNILVVDDAPPVRMMLQGYLAKLGIRPEDIRVAEDGVAGLDAFHAKTPDLVFVDIEMPRMGGEETATAMLTEKPDLKVVVMTGVEETDARVKQLRSWGAFAILPKPIRFERIKEVLELIAEDENQFDRIR